MHLCQRSSDHITINTTCSPKIINWSVLEVAKLVLTRGAIWRYLKLKITSVITNIWRVCQTKELLCLISVSYHLNLIPSLFKNCQILLAPPFHWHSPKGCQLGIQMSIICVGWTPSFCCWHWWQLSFVSHSWCICISAQSSNKKACRAEN